MELELAWDSLHLKEARPSPQASQGSDQTKMSRRRGLILMQSKTVADVKVSCIGSDEREDQRWLVELIRAVLGQV